jgi:hypothetical protein
MAEISNIDRQFVLGSDGVTYFEVTTTNYTNEEQTVSKRLIGPASVLLQTVSGDIQNKAATLARDADNVSRAKQSTLDWIGDDTEIKSITGFSPLKQIQDAFEAVLIAAGWIINDGTGDLPIVFSVNAQGQLKYNVNGTGNKNATLFGSVIRLNNYPAAPTDTEFFLSLNGKRFFSLPNRAAVIKTPTGIQFR